MLPRGTLAGAYNAAEKNKPTFGSRSISGQALPASETDRERPATRLKDRAPPQKEIIRRICTAYCAVNNVRMNQMLKSVDLSTKDW